MATIKKQTLRNGKTRYKAIVRLRGFQSRTRTFDKLTHAKLWANSLESDLKLSRTLPDIVASRHTVAEMVDRYLQEIDAMKANRPRYFYDKKSQLLWWKKEIGSYRLSLVTRDLLWDCGMRLLKSGRKGRRSNATVNRYFSALKHAMDMTVKEWHWMGHNPLSGMKKYKEPLGRVRFLSSDEKTALLSACREEKKKPLEIIVLIAMSAGPRKGEILTLKRRDVDLERGHAVTHNTKNGTSRQIFLNENLVKMLREWLVRCPIKSDYVFPARGGKAPMTVDNEWQKALAASGIKDFRFHDLRHTAASYIAMTGGTLAEIGTVLGHKSTKVTERYTHLLDTHVQGVVERMNERMVKA